MKNFVSAVLKAKGKAMDWQARQTEQRQAEQKKRQMAWHDISEARRPFDPLLRIPVNNSRLNNGNSYFFEFPYWCTHENGSYYYVDILFACRDCGKICLWTAESQKWWYEEMQGLVHTTAYRCRACRIKERERKAEMRRVREEGKQRKQARLVKHAPAPHSTALSNKIPE